jgi:bacterial/archaeal transporter family protein
MASYSVRKMELWILYAILAAVFAGLTAVLAKLGIEKIHPDLGLAIRSVVICFAVLILNLAAQRGKDIAQISSRTWVLLIASGLTTTFSWLFYYRAIKAGPVSYVAAIDKSSVVVTIALSALILGEPLTWRLAVGATLVLSGMLVLINK